MSMLTLTAHRTKTPAPRHAAGHYRLAAEWTWLVDGDEASVREVEAALPDFCTRVGRALLVEFGNAVGWFSAGPLGRLEVHSGKWEQRSFDRMLADITDRMALLPFAASTGGQLGSEHSPTSEHQVLYHAFLYLRHLLSETAPPEDRLVAALRLIVAQPHRRFDRVSQWSPITAVQRVEPRALLSMVTPRADLTRVPAGRGGALATALRGHLPQRVEDTRMLSTVDVPENQFVKAFLDRALWIVEQVRALAQRQVNSFGRRLAADCDAIERELAPLRRHALWDQVGELRRIPAESQVLQRRRGYREILRYFVRIRLTARLPLEPEATRRMLEIKDIAELYEMWCFFEVERQVSLALGRPPIAAGSPSIREFGQAHLGRGLRVAWDGGFELFYNLSYSRTNTNSSYSVPLRPDVVLRILNGPAKGDHLFDAKFKVRKLAKAMPTTDEPDESNLAAERKGVYANADVYKMHTYRDAIANARTVWILYPGSELRFFDKHNGVLSSVEQIRADASGVGAIPLVPDQLGSGVCELVQRLICTDPR